MFEYVIVGAGTAGCVLANRLTANGASVALVEAGPPKHGEFRVRAPGMYVTLWRSNLDWNFTTEPQAHVEDRRMFWPRGKVTGGTGSLNALVYIRGHPDNYDSWRAAGNFGWGYDEILPFFTRSEDNSRGASKYHGSGGPMAVDDLPSPGPGARAFVESMSKACKVPINDDFNGASQVGAGYYQYNIRRGERFSSANGFLDTAMRGHKSLTLITDALVTGLVLDGDRVKGVRLRERGAERTIEASREVILCAGAIGSPHLLMLAGIGAGDELRAAGVTPAHELAGVGKHLEDHLLCGAQYHATGGVDAMTKARLALWAAQYQLLRKGPLGRSAVQAGGFVKHAADARVPDVQFFFVPWGFSPPNSDEKRPPPFGRYYTILSALLYPKSHGEVRLRSADPAQAPAIDPRYLSDPADLEHLVDGIELSREIAATGPLAKLTGKERDIGLPTKTRDDLRGVVRRAVNTIFHPTGTCKMGPRTDPSAVVDAELRVHGIRGLRVADASIMPSIIGGNTNAPTVMIAEKAADFLLHAR
ncbi:MAG: GMC family oxidoreductase [Kofleriaceae bacterium]